MYVSRASRGFNYSEPLKRADKHYIYAYIMRKKEERKKKKKNSLSLEPTRMRALEERKASIRFNFHPGGHNRTIESYSLCKNWLCFLETIHSTPRHAEITTIIRQFGRPCVQKNSKANKQGSNRNSEFVQGLMGPKTFLTKFSHSCRHSPRGWYESKRWTLINRSRGSGKRDKKGKMRWLTRFAASIAFTSRYIAW